MRLVLGLGFALAAATLLIPPPEGLSVVAWRTLGLGLVMALWWMTEAIPLAATALIPLAVFPAFGVLDMTRTAEVYAHPLVVLFLGGFLLARTVERWGLHRRLAAAMLRGAGRDPASVVGGV